MLVVHGARGRLEYLSPACRELLGREPDELLGRDPRSWPCTPRTATTSPPPRGVAAGADTLTVTCRLRRADDGLGVGGDAAAGPARRARPRGRGALDGARHLRPHGGEDARSRRPRRGSARRSRRRRSAWRSPRSTATSSASTARSRDCSATPRPSSRGVTSTRSRTPTTAAADRDGHGRDARRRPHTFRTEKRYLHANGETVWAALSSTLVRAPDGAPLYFLSQMQDVTERRRYEARAAPPRRPRPAHRACSTGARSSASSTRHVALVGRYGAARRGARARPRPLQDDQRHARPRRRGRADRARRRARCARGCARPTCSRGSAATSSPCCCPRAAASEAEAVAEGVLEARARPGGAGELRARAAASGEHRHRAVRRDERRSPATPCSSTRTSRCTRPRRRAATASRSPRADESEAPLGARISWAERDPRRARGGPLRAARAADRRHRDRRGSASTSCCCAWSTTDGELIAARRVPAASRSAST